MANEIQIVISAITKGLSEATSAVNSNLNSIQAATRSLGQGMTTAGMAITAGFTLPVLGVGVASVKLASDMEQNTIAFTTMMGSADAAKKHLEDLRAFAMKTPFEFTDLVDASKRLQAMGFEAEEVIPVLTSVGNAAAALGKGKEGIDRITLALGQMRAKQKVSAEEMKQLTEAGIPAWQMLADAIGVDVPTAMKMAEQSGMSLAERQKDLEDEEEKLRRLSFDLAEAQDELAKNQKPEKAAELAEKVRRLTYEYENQKEKVAAASEAIKRGTLDADTAVSAILAGMGEKYSGLMEKQSKTIAGQWSNLKDEIVAIMTDLGTELLPVAQDVLSVVKEAMPLIKQALAIFKGLSPELKTLAIAMTGIVMGGGVLLVVFGQILTMVSGLIPIISGLSAALGGAGAGGAAAGLGTSIAALALPIAAIVAAIGVLVGALLWLWENSEGFRASIINMWNNIQKKFEETIAAIKPVLDKLIADFKSTFDTLWPIIKVFLDVISQQFGYTFVLVAGIVSTFVNIVLDLIGGLFRILGELTMAAMALLRGDWDDAINHIIGALSGLKDTVFNIMGDLAEGIGNIITGVINTALYTVGDRIKGYLRPVIDWLNSLIRTVNRTFGLGIGEIILPGGGPSGSGTANSVPKANSYVAQTGVSKADLRHMGEDLRTAIVEAGPREITIKNEIELDGDKIGESVVKRIIAEEGIAY